MPSLSTFFSGQSFPASTDGLFGVVAYAADALTNIAHTAIDCTDSTSRTGTTPIMNQVNSTLAITSRACLTPASANFSVWLTDTANVPVSTSNSTIFFDNCLSGTLTKGCASLVAPTKIYLPGTQSNVNVSLPVQVNCGTENATDYVLAVFVNTSTMTCRPAISFPSCSIPAFNLTYSMTAADNCNGVVGSTATIELRYFSPADYALAVANNFRVESWGSFLQSYPFRVGGPVVVKEIVPGTPTTVVVGNVSVVTPASLLPSGLNGSLIVEINNPNASATVIAAVDVKLNNGSKFHVYNLSVPLQVTFPLFPPTPCKDSVCHYWDVTDQAWSTEGCETLQSAAGEWICSCTHATDFSILLIDSPSCAAELASLAPALEPFYLYSSLYILLGLLASYSAFRVMALRSGHWGIISEHLGVVAICGLRTFLSLYQTGVSGPVTAVALSTISAVPRLLEFTVFSFIIATWGALLHFSMGTSNPFRKARPYFIGVNVFAAAIVCYVFIAFAVSPSYDAAIIGEALLGVNSALLSLGFLVYATWLHKQFSKAGGSGITDTSCCTSRTTLVYLGWLLSFSFVAQSVFACLALTAIPRDGTVSVDVTEARFFIDLYNGLFRLFNITTLGCIIALYWDGIRKIVAKQSQKGSSSYSSSARPMQSMS